MVARIGVWLLAMFFLVGCSSVRYKPTRAPAQQPIVSTQPSWSLDYSTTPETVQSYQYGRFTVRLDKNGLEVKRGVFAPPMAIPFASTGAHVISINYRTKELWYHKRTNAGVYEPVIGYAVMTPNPSVLPKEVVRGKVIRIVKKPTWCPKVGGTVRQEDPTLPGCIPYEHSQNAMGDWRFDIAWNAPGWELNKLHGVEGYAKGEFWTEKTHGCIRLTNEAIKKLVDLLGPNAVKEGIEIVAWS